MDIHGYFTKKGLRLAAKLAAGSTLKITRVCAGAAETDLTASALSQIQQMLRVGEARCSAAAAVLPVTLAAGLAEQPLLPSGTAIQPGGNAFSGPEHHRGLLPCRPFDGGGPGAAPETCEWNGRSVSHSGAGGQ